MAATVVVPGGSEAFRINYLLPAGGGGLRFQLSKAYRVNLRADFARGEDTWTRNLNSSSLEWGTAEGIQCKCLEQVQWP